LLQPTATAASTSAPPAASPLVPAVVRAVALLERLARQRQPMSMASLASELALPKSSVHGLCNTLLSFGYLRRQADGGLSIGPRVMGLAEAFVAGTDVAREFDALWSSVKAPDETVLLSVLDGADVVYLSARNGTRPLGLAFTPGMRLPAHLAATGRAMLAYAQSSATTSAASSAATSAPDSVPAAGPVTMPQQALQALTPRSLTEPAALAAELAATRQRGFSIDDEGVRLGVYCVAAPVLDAGGRPVAGVGVCLNKATLSAADLARQQQRVVDTARALSQRLGGDAPAAIQPSFNPARSA
jgi:DNA-binding IclR family transcriptional regulator